MRGSLSPAILNCVKDMIRVNRVYCYCIIGLLLGFLYAKH